MITVQGLGRLVKDPEIKEANNGNVYVRFSIASNKTVVNKTTGEVKEITNYYDCVAWNKYATQLAGATKGNQVFIHGELEKRSKEDNGVKKWFTNIVVDFLAVEDSSGATSSAFSNFGEDEATNSQDSKQDALPF